MATIIKCGTNQAQVSGPEVLRADYRFEDFESKAEQYLDKVRSEAARIVQQAHSEAETIRRDAETAGRQSAIEAAEKVLDEKVGNRLKTLHPALQQAVQGIEDSKHEWTRHWERATVRLARAIAERVIRKAIDAEPELPAVWIAESLSLVSGGGAIQLRLHPDDAASLGANVESILAEIGRLGSCTIVTDAAIDRGGCRITTEFGEIDQQIETQLARIEEELLGQN